MLCFALAMSSQHRENNKQEECEALLLALGAGEQNAFSALYELIKTPVYSFALSILRNPHDASDIMQETFLKIHAHCATYKPGGKPMAWIFTITRNLCLMHLRRMSSHEMPLNDELDLESEHDLQSQVENSDLIERLMTLLSDEERQIVVLHVVSGQKHKDIAHLLDLPLSTVLSKYNRSLHKLKKSLQREELSS